MTTDEKRVLTKVKSILDRALDSIPIDTLELRRTLTEVNATLANNGTSAKRTYVGDKVVGERGGLRGAGTVIGTRRCQLTGCMGLRLITKWPDGYKTMPCTKGMEYDEATRVWKIR